MSFNPNQSYRTVQAGYAATGSAALDAGLRAYMLRVYNWMASGLVLTGLIAYAIANTSLINLFYHQVATARGIMTQPTLLGYGAIFLPLIFVMVLSFGVNKLSTRNAQALFWGFCAAMGLSLANIFLIYTATSIATVFFVTAAMFGATSLYGYATGRDLTSWGSFFFMGLIGVLIAMVVNFFLHSSALAFAISLVGVFVFLGLTAYDTQRIKTSYIQFGTSYGMEMASKRSVYDALTLYLNFINLFMFMLQLFGQRGGQR